jgi:hypothetical protein
MDDYDNMSLQELQKIVRDKYHMETPPHMQIDDVIDWLRFQDANIETSTPISVIPEIQNLPVITPTIPTLTTIPSLVDIPTIPSFGVNPPRHKFFLSDENTLRTLHGTPTLPWETDLSILNNIRNQSDLQSVNPNAAFQSKILHPNQRRPHVTPGFPGIIPLPQAFQHITTPIISKIVPTVPKSPVRIQTPPKSPSVPKPVITFAPLIPKPVTTFVPLIPKPVTTFVPTTPIIVPTVPKSPSVPKPVTTFAPLIPKPVTTFVPTTPIIVPTVPKSPSVPKPVTTFAPTTTIIVPTIPKPSTTFVPSVPKPSTTFVPSVPKPSTTFVPSVPKPSTTFVPSVPKPSTTFAMVTPPAVNPINLKIAQSPIIPVPGMITLNVTPVAHIAPIIKARSPFGPLTPSAPILQQIPESPGFQMGAQVAGFTTIRATTLTPTIPNVLLGQRGTFPSFNIAPPAQSNVRIPSIMMPTFNTAVSPVITTIKRPTAMTLPQQNLQLPPTPGTTESIIAVLNEINPDLLTGERTGKNKKGYSLNALQSYSQRLGLTVSGKRKQELIDNIQMVRRDMGLL